MPSCGAADGLRWPLSEAVSGLTWRAEWDASVLGPPLPGAYAVTATDTALNPVSDEELALPNVSTAVSGDGSSTISGARGFDGQAGAAVVFAVSSTCRTGEPAPSRPTGGGPVFTAHGSTARRRMISK